MVVTAFGSSHCLSCERFGSICRVIPVADILLDQRFRSSSRMARLPVPAVVVATRRHMTDVSYLLDSGSPNLLRSGFAADTRGPSACSGLRRPGDRVASKDRLKGA